MNPHILLKVIIDSLHCVVAAEPQITNDELEQLLDKVKRHWLTERPLTLHTIN